MRTIEEKMVTSDKKIVLMFANFENGSIVIYVPYNVP